MYYYINYFTYKEMQNKLKNSLSCGYTYAQTKDGARDGDFILIKPNCLYKYNYVVREEGGHYIVNFVEHLTEQHYKLINDYNNSLDD